MLVSELMTAPPVTIRGDRSIKEAARLLRDRNVAAVPVLDSGDALVGMVSELDLLRATVLPDPVAHLMPPTDALPELPTTVADVMSVDVLVLQPHSDLYDALRLMQTSGVRSLPVIEHGRVVGVLSRADLLRMLARDDEQIAADVRRELQRELGAHAPWSVDVDDGIVTLTGTGRVDGSAAGLLAVRVPGVVRVQVRPSA